MSMKSKLRCQSGSAEFICYDVFVSHLGCVLIRGFSLVSRLSSRNYTSFSSFSFDWPCFYILVLTRLCY